MIHQNYEWNINKINEKERKKVGTEEQKRHETYIKQKNKIANPNISILTLSANESNNPIKSQRLWD